ncbi:MAG: hypothetical protein K2Y18_07060 [Alphaproteobacteria bacterium]|jgi:hypothetical protein|nr:hypothetical protein [Alphaproteobacteria bacterium]
MKIKLFTITLMATIAFENNARGIDLDNLEGKQPDNRSVKVTTGQAARGTPALSDQAKPVLKAQSALPSSSSNSPARPVQAKSSEPEKKAAPPRSTRKRVTVSVNEEQKGTSLANPTLSSSQPTGRHALRQNASSPPEIKFSEIGAATLKSKDFSWSNSPKSIRVSGDHLEKLASGEQPFSLGGKKYILKLKAPNTKELLSFIANSKGLNKGLNKAEELFILSPFSIYLNAESSSSSQTTYNGVSNSTSSHSKEIKNSTTWTIVPVVGDGKGYGGITFIVQEIK